MDTIKRFVGSLFSDLAGMDPQSFGIIVAMTVIFGYFMLRGNAIR